MRIKIKNKPHINFPVRVEHGTVVDADGAAVATTYAPGDLDWSAQDRFRQKMAELIADAMNKGQS